MKLILQSFLYCYLLTTVAYCVELDISPKLRKRLSVWMENRSERTAESQQFVRPEEVRDPLSPHSSNDISIRTKRSKNSVNQSRRQGCSLGTCTVHDLAHRLHVFNNKQKIGSAPIDKISPQGYGRRRRSVPGRRATLQLEHGRLRPVWSNTDSQVHRLETLLRRT